MQKIAMVVIHKYTNFGSNMYYCHDFGNFCVCWILPTLKMLMANVLLSPGFAMESEEK